MSTSARPAPTLSGMPAGPDVLNELKAFPYECIGSGASPGPAMRGVAPEVNGSGYESSAAMEEEGRAQARREALAEAQKTFEERLSKERASLAAALDQFSRDRVLYFEKVELQVLQLALGIARKILHRESQIDPMVLAAIVRVELDQINDATRVLLRLHPRNVEEWRKYLASHVDPANVPEIVEDSSQPLNECLLETSMGTTTLGLEPQLKEIEQGLMDLLASRPGESR